jgi:hypothetical protein
MQNIGVHDERTVGKVLEPPTPEVGLAQLNRFFGGLGDQGAEVVSMKMVTVNTLHEWQDKFPDGPYHDGRQSLPERRLAVTVERPERGADAPGHEFQAVLVPRFGVPDDQTVGKVLYPIPREEEQTLRNQFLDDLSGQGCKIVGTMRDSFNMVHEERARVPRHYDQHRAIDETREIVIVRREVPLNQEAQAVPTPGAVQGAHPGDQVEGGAKNTGAVPKPKIEISDEAPLDTAQLRSHEVFAAGDPEGQVPDVVLASAPLNPMDRPRPTATRVGIYEGGERAGALNVMQTPSRTWLNDVRIEPHRQGERLAVAAYMGIIAAAHDTGRRVQSDPGGLSPDSTRVWESLTRRGIAEVVDGAYDQHGHPQFISRPPEAETP